MQITKYRSMTEETVTVELSNKIPDLLPDFKVKI